MNMVYGARYGNIFDIAIIQKNLLLGDFRMEKDAEVLIVEREQADSLAFIFPFGSVVYWGYTEVEKSALEEFILTGVKPSVLPKKFYEDEFSVEIAEEFSIKNDILSFPKLFSLSEKLAVSYAIAQSTALFAQEETIAKAELLVAEIPNELAEKGKSQLSGISLRKLIGKVLQKKHEINLGMGFSESPDYFWEYPECQSMYQKVYRYLEIQGRIISLNKKMEILHETLEVLRDESNTRHSANLEWIIIWLIVFEVLMTLWDKFIA